ncbi:MAG TPA: hypothetical protein VJ000_03210 [Thermodesulfovibrionia bacterium]|nr:hypothetical protein [Thermodesulfovibrionia bacterium]
MPFLFVFIWCSNALSDDSNIQDIKIRRETRLLELEAKAAAKPVAYVVLDMAKKKIYLKIRGVTLKEFDIVDSDTIGIGQLNESYSLVNVKAIFAPKRKEIKPLAQKKEEKTSSTTQEVDSYSVEDMPSNYTLILDKGLSISVSQHFKGNFLLSTLNYINKKMSRLWNSSKLLWSYLKKTPFIKIHAVMSKDDAHAFYWALPEKAEVIIIKQP